MKRTLLFSALVCSMVGTAQLSQSGIDRDGLYNPAKKVETQAPVQSAMIGATDTLEYFMNKHFYRNTTSTVTYGSPENNLFFTFPMPYTNTIQISHCGSIFTNSASVQVHGLQGIFLRDPQSVSASIPVKLYLCNLNASNLPVMPPLDSITTNITTALNGAWVGGNFTSPVTVTTNFAVLVKNASQISGDTIRPFMNNAATLSSTVPVRQRFGENFGLMNLNGNFMTTAQAFGASSGVDYEFLVAPRVSFDYFAGATASTASVCINASGSFSNTTIPLSIVENRQWNFIQFYKRWRTNISASQNTLQPLPTIDSLYQWTITGAAPPVSYEKNPSVTFNTSGNQTGQLTVSYQPGAFFGLHNSYTDVDSDIINVSSASAPILSVSGSTDICAGQSTTLTVSGNPTFTWTNPVSNANSVVVTPGSQTIYTVMANNGGCTAIKTITVAVTAAPNVQVSGPSSGCVGEAFVITATGAQSYLWSNTSSQSSQTLSSVSPGVLSYTVTGTSGPCPASTAVKDVTIHAKPVASLSAVQNTVCSKATGGTSVALIGLPTGPGGVYSGNNVVGPMFTPNTVGTSTISFEYTDPSTNCKSETVKTTISVLACTPSAIGEQSRNNVLVFPNPATGGIVNITNLSGVTKLALFNILGEVVQIEKVSGDQHTLDMSSLPQGQYFIRLESSNGAVQTVKIVNHR